MRKSSWAIAFLAAALVAAPSAGAAFGSFGTFVTSLSTADLVPAVDVPATDVFCIGYVRDPSALTDASKRAWFFHIATDGDCTGEIVTATRSFRYTLYGGTASLGWITSTDTTYINDAFDAIEQIAAGATWLCTMESDGIPGWTPGDPVIIDREVFEGGAGGTLTQNDVHLIGVSSTTNAPFSTSPGIVKTTDTALTLANKADDDPTVHPIANTLSCGNFSARVLDLGATGTYDSQDTYYLVRTTSITSAFVSQGAARLTTGNGLTGGQMVAASGTDQRNVLVTLDSSAAAADTTGACAATCQVALAVTGTGTTASKKLYIHVIDGSGLDTRILRGDVALKTSTTTSAAGAGTVVTTTTAGAGDVIVGGLYSLQDLFYYLDTDGDGIYDVSEPTYIKHPDNIAAAGDVYGGTCGAAAAGERCLEANDYRVKTTSGQTTGSLVLTTQSDYTAYRTTAMGHTGFLPKWYAPKLDTRATLTQVTNAKFVDNDADNLWDPASEDVYITASTTVTNGDTRVWVDGAEVSETATCPGDADCGATYDTTTFLRTTGPDTTWTAASNEQLVWSHDALLTQGDYRLQTLGALADGLVGAADAALGSGLLIPTGTQVYMAQDAAFPFPQPGDVQLMSGFGTQLTSTSAGVVPQTTVATARLIVADFGVQNELSKDTYYLDFSGSFQTGQVLRITPLDATVGSGAAGNFLTASNTAETSAAKLTDADVAGDLAFIAGPLGGFNTDSTVYVNLPAALGGTAGTTLTQWDSRLTPYTQGSCTGCTAGSRVRTGDGDASGAPALTDPGTFQVLWWDANNDASADSEDFFWVHHGVDSPTTPSYLDVRLGGAGGGGAASTGGGGTSGGGGGGGGSNPVVTPTPTPTPSGSGSSSDSGSVSGSVSSSGSDSPGDGDVNLAAANVAIAESLRVRREDGVNELTWDPQPGVDGYQIWSSESPFVLLTTLRGQSSSSYSDNEGGKDTKYLVTAFVGSEELTADDVNNGDVPGYSGVPEGEDPKAGSRGFIPAPSLVLVLAGLVAAIFVARRRL